jgi:hypothetical protein
MVQDELNDEVRRMRESKRTLILGTVSSDGWPDASYAPYVESEGAFFVFVSRLAKHTGNLLESQRCHVLFIEDEQETTNLFARRRLSYHCQVSDLDRDSPEGIARLEEFLSEFGPVVNMLRSLPDFHLLKLQPIRGSFVRGFGQAFSL